MFTYPGCLLVRAAKLGVILCVSMLSLLMTGEGAAQEVKDPVPRDSGAINVGRSLFRLQCAFCHGIDARGGGRGPDLTTGYFVHGASDSALYRTITQGVPGTQMRGFGGMEEDEIWSIIGFLRTVGTETSAPVAGDRAAGEEIFFGAGGCARCHMVKTRGGRLGPNLSRIGASRAARYLIEKARDPSKDISEDYETVTVVTKRGESIRGVRKNEDTFSIQLMDEQERFHLLLKKDLREVRYEKTSLMPAYDERTLSEEDLQDLVAYLQSLQGE